MEKLTRNPLFYTSLVLAVLLGFQTYSLVSAYTPPAGSPPDAGKVAEPLDTSSFPQTKIGALKIGLDAMPNVAVDPTGQSITFNNATGDGGTIYYANGKLMYMNQDRVGHEIGSGIGGGTGGVNIWSYVPNSQDIYYSGGSVYIGAVPAENQYTFVRENSGFFNSAHKLPCSSQPDDNTVRDCPSDLYATVDPVGSTAYDNYTKLEHSSNNGATWNDGSCYAAKLDNGKEYSFVAVVSAAICIERSVPMARVYTVQELSQTQTYIGITPTGFTGGVYVDGKWVPDGTQISCTALWGGGNDSIHYARVHNGRLEVRAYKPGNCDSGWVAGREAKCSGMNPDTTIHYVRTHLFSGLQAWMTEDPGILGVSVPRSPRSIDVYDLFDVVGTQYTYESGYPQQQCNANF